jgi:hypothetical protein
MAELSDNDLKFQVELTKRLGMPTSYKLNGHGKEIKIVRKRYFDKVSDAVTSDGSIRLSNPGHAVKVLERLGIKVDYHAKGNFTLALSNGDIYYNVNSPAAGTYSTAWSPTGAPLGSVKIGFALDFDIHNPDLEIRKNHRIELRKAIWHELMELALLAINGIVFNQPEIKVVGWTNFADDHVGKYARVTKQSYNNRFFPWLGDTVPTTRQKGKPALDIPFPYKPVKELRINYKTTKRLTGRITDYKKTKVYDVNIPPGKGTFTWGAHADPGEYWFETDIDSFAIRERFELLAKKPLSLKAVLKRDQFGDLHMIIEYQNWPRNKHMGIKIFNSHSNVPLHMKETERTDGKIIWGKSHSFKREDYAVQAFVHGNGDNFLRDRLEKGELIKPQKIKLDFGSRWMVEPRARCAYVRILYKDWHGYFVCKVKNTSGKTVETFKKTDRAGYIDWGRSSNVKPGKYIIEATIDKGIFETETAVISE